MFSLFIYDKNESDKKAKGSYYFPVVIFLDSLPDLVQPQCQSVFGYLQFLITIDFIQWKYQKQLKLNFINRLGLCPV